MKYSIFILLLTAIGVTYAESHYVGWVGEIESITEFKEGALPEDIEVGSLIAVSISYDSAFAYEERSILGSNSSGTIFRFPADVIQKMMIKDHIWVVEGADIEFSTWTSSSWNPTTGQVITRTEWFNIYSISDRNSVVTFPGFSGAFEMGFAVGDDTSPHELYQSGELENPQFDFQSFTREGGHLSSRFFDENGDIADGFYLRFKITRVLEDGLPPAVKMTKDSDDLRIEFFGDLRSSLDLVEWNSLDPQPSSPYIVNTGGSHLFFKSEVIGSNQSGDGQ